MFNYVAYKDNIAHDNIAHNIDTIWFKKKSNPIFPRFCIHLWNALLKYDCSSLNAPMLSGCN